MSEPGRRIGTIGRISLALAAGSVAAATAALAQSGPSGGAAPTAAALEVLARSGDWTAYMHAGPPRLCFVLGASKEGEAKGAPRGLVHVFVSAWPDEGVRSEVSLKAAAPFRKGSEVNVSIGALSFRLFTQGDRAWVGDAVQELKLVEAMRKGARMVVQGVGEKGASATDAVSLAGLGQALQALAQGCK